MDFNENFILGCSAIGAGLGSFPFDYPTYLG